MLKFRTLSRFGASWGLSGMRCLCGRSAVATVSAVLNMAVAAGGDITIYVAPGGNDGDAGTIQNPLATLAGARDRVRVLKAGGDQITVEFGPGTYRFDAPVSFEAADSGTEKGPVIYRAAAAGEVRFSGGRDVAGWSRVTNDSIRRQLAPEALDHIQVADLRSQGITDYGALATRGFGRISSPAEAELLWNHRPMRLARWPNEGFRSAFRIEDDVEHVVVDTNRVARWVEERDPWIFAYWFHDWAELYEPIVGIDAAKQMIIRSADISPSYGINPSRTRWYGLNLLSELDLPGEYYLDREQGLLYFWPPDGGGSTAITQAHGLVSAENLSHVSFEGITFEACRATAITMSGGSDNRIAGCTIRNTGHAGINISGANHEVFGCDVYDTGEGGIFMSGGDRPTLTPSGHNAENNHIHHYSRRVRTYHPAISVGGVGGRIAHNLIHDGPHMALSAGGNDHLIEYNEIHNVVYESGDAGAFYVGRDWTQQGTILRYNYWHHIVGAGGDGGITIYLDDQQSGHTIHGNLFERTSYSTFIGGGRDNRVTNNVFIDCWRGAHMDNRGMGWMHEMTQDPDGTLRTRLRGMPYQGALWSERYPMLPNILDDEPAIPKRNVFQRNISAGRRWDDINRQTRQYQTIEDNLIFDDDVDWIRLIKGVDGKPRRLEFKDPAAVEEIDFEALPLEKMGLYEDAARASWPVHHEVREIELREPIVMANLSLDPQHVVHRSETMPVIDGMVAEAEWAGADTMSLAVNYLGGFADPAAIARFKHDAQSLYVGMSTSLPEERHVGDSWGNHEAVELAFRVTGSEEILLFRGFATGTWHVSEEAGTSASTLAQLTPDVRYVASLGDDGWSAEWHIPLANLGMTPPPLKLEAQFNLSVRRVEEDVWVMWRPTMGNTWNVANVGRLKLEP